MSNPSFSNIDLWLFELAEGNLSPEQIEQLELFLLNHPELDVDRDVWEMAKVDKIPVVYPEIASLEKKRRPVAAFTIAGVFLFLIGTGSFMAWNGNFDSFTEADLKAQNDQVKSLLIERVRNLQNESAARQTDLSNTGALVNSSEFGKLSLMEVDEIINPVGSGIDNGIETSGSSSGVFIASTNPNPSETGNNLPVHVANNTTGNFGQSNATSNIFELSHGVSAQVQNQAQSVTNQANQSYESGLSDRLTNTSEVGEKNFYVREPSELKIYEGRVWNERKTPWEKRTYSYSSSTGSNHRSFKERFNRFTRSLERMMNSPIALKNSRDPHYDVPGVTANDISFSSAGTLITTRVQTMSRLQWQGKENEQLMNQISADGYSYGIRGGWGVQLNHQMYNNGGIHVGQVAFTYSPKISVSNWFSVEPSVRVKMGNKRLNSELMGGTNVVEVERGNSRDFYADGATPIGRSLWYKDLGLGLLVNTKWFFAGIQGDNLFRHKDNLYSANWSDPRRVENHFTATIGSDWVSRDQSMSLSPYVVYQKNENLSELWAGASFAYEWLNIGIAASNKLEPAVSIGMKFSQFSMHYNADYTQSAMLDEKALSHQLTLRFLVNSNKTGKRLFNR